MEQPQAISRALNYGARLMDDSSKLGGLDKNKDTLKGVRHLVIAACGTSYFSGLAGAQIMRTMRSFETIQGTTIFPQRSSSNTYDYLQ